MRLTAPRGSFEMLLISFLFLNVLIGRNRCGATAIRESNSATTYDDCMDLHYSTEARHGDHLSRTLCLLTKPKLNYWAILIFASSPSCRNCFLLAPAENR